MAKSQRIKPQTKSYMEANMKEFKGVITPMVTPFKEDEEIDWELLDQHVEFLIAKGVHCLAPTGSTGEFESLTFDEVIGIYQAVVKKVAGRVPVIGGMGGRSTRESIAMARAAEKAGVDGLLVLPPYYYGFNQEEIIAYYQQIADSTSLLIMLYNNPGKTKVDVTPDMVARLSRVPNIRYMKESSGDMRRIKEVIERTDESFIVIGGWDSIFLESLLMGARGMVSGTSNVAPEALVRLYSLVEEGAYAEALEYYKAVHPFLSLMEDYGRLAAWVKASLRLRGQDCGYPRRPYAPISPEEVERIRSGMKTAGVPLI